ncbi:hypothetical protein J6590_047115 [Homalodisca vitripennis]|nr:hypothetical protein J6590_047115 [Homalodisca vitripennis]
MESITGSYEFYITLFPDYMCSKVNSVILKFELLVYKDIKNDANKLDWKINEYYRHVEGAGLLFVTRVTREPSPYVTTLAIQQHNAGFRLAIEAGLTTRDLPAH